jgi:hypothetical protein
MSEDITPGTVEVRDLKIAKYMVIPGSNLKDFEELISSYIEEGWQPWGSLQVTTYERPSGVREWFYQAMVKRGWVKVEEPTQ